MPSRDCQLDLFLRRRVPSEWSRVRIRLRIAPRGMLPGIHEFMSVSSLTVSRILFPPTPSGRSV